eukprot:gene24725-29877_t
MYSLHRSKSKRQLEDERMEFLGAFSKASSFQKSRQELNDDKLDHIEEQLLKKAEILSGFADGNGKMRYLFQTLKFFDKNNVGYISFPDFLDVLQKFNLMNLSREAEELFNRYDADMLGHVDCRDLAHRLYRVPPHNCAVLSAAGKSTVFALRAALASRGWEAGVRYVRKALQLAPLDAEGNASLQEIIEVLFPITENKVCRRDFVSLLCELNDGRVDGKVDLFGFLSVMKSYMELRRKRLVRLIYDRIDTEGRGYISEDDVATHYRPALSVATSSPRRTLPPLAPLQSASSAGAAEAETAQGVLELMRRAQRQQRVVGITWAAFLDFHRCLSMAIDSDADFESTLKQRWSFGYPSRLSSPASVAAELDRDFSLSSMCRGTDFLLSKARPTDPITLLVKVTHSDGRESEVQLRDDLGTHRFHLPSLEKQVSNKGIRDIQFIHW